MTGKKIGHIKGIECGTVTTGDQRVGRELVGSEAVAESKQNYIALCKL